MRQQSLLYPGKTLTLHMEEGRPRAGKCWRWHATQSLASAKHLLVAASSSLSSSSVNSEY